MPFTIQNILTLKIWRWRVWGFLKNHLIFINNCVIIVLKNRRKNMLKKELKNFILSTFIFLLIFKIFFSITTIYITNSYLSIAITTLVTFLLKKIISFESN